MEALIRIIGQVAKTRTMRIITVILAILTIIAFGYLYLMPLIIVALIVTTVYVMVKAARKVLAN